MSKATDEMKEFELQELRDKLQKAEAELADEKRQFREYRESQQQYLFHLEGAIEKMEAELAALKGQLEAAKKDADDWKRHWKMYRDAWVRELGGWLVPKHHEIDALVLTTRKRCVNPLLGNCKTPHWLGEPTADKKALQQNPHPQNSDCREWAIDVDALPPQQGAAPQQHTCDYHCYHYCAGGAAAKEEQGK